MAQVPTQQKYSQEKASKLLEQLHCFIAAKGYSQGKVADMIGIAPSSLSGLFRGGYCGDAEGHLARVEQFLDREAERAEKPSLATFVDTSVSTSIFKALRQNHVHGTMGAVMGDSGIGKTRSFREYALRNEGVIIITASTWMRSHVQLSKKLAEILGEKRFRTQDRCEALVEKLLGASRLLIIDQAHQLRDDAIEFLQNLWDQCNPTEDERRLGIVLGCTWRFYNQIYAENAKYLFEQLTSRIDAGISCSFPSCPFTLADIRKLFCSDNIKFPMSDAALNYLLKVANSPGALRSAVANVEHLQDIMGKQKAREGTQVSADMLKAMQQIMFEESGMNDIGIQINAVLKTLAIRKRYLLLLCIADGKIRLKDLARITGVTQQRARWHLALMASLGLVEDNGGGDYGLGRNVRVTEQTIAINVSGYPITIGLFVKQEAAS